MSEDDFDEVGEKRSGIWIWLLIVVLFVLLLVPVVSIALAVKRTEWIPLRKKQADQRLEQTRHSGNASQGVSDQSLSLRDRVELLASTFIKAPQLRSKMEQVSIGTASPSAPFSVREILQQRHHQFVEAVDKDKVRIVVILPSREWPELSNALQAASQKDGFRYSGPQSTSSAADDSDSMVAEIEIVRSAPTHGNGADVDKTAHAAGGSRR